MLEKIPIENILFLDIETVPQNEQYDDLSDDLKKFWSRKSSQINREKTPEENYTSAGIYAEFGKIVCISVGIAKSIDGELTFHTKSYFGDDEKKLLQDFTKMLHPFSRKPDKKLCAHNGIEFDFPYIARRCIINGVKIPAILDNAGKKPWEIKGKLLDTMDLWKFGDYKNYTSLSLLCTVLNIPTPKDDIDGSMVGEVYWKNKELERITTYCEKDVLAIAQVFLRHQRKDIISPENVTHVQ